MTRVAVVGVGSIGRNHVRVLHEIPQAELVGIVDANIEMATQLARLYNTTAYPSLEALLAATTPEAVTVSVPTQGHYEVVKTALNAGCHVLVEKPIASTVAEAMDIVALAKQQGRILTVGHIERYNPAIIELKRRLQDGQLGRVFQVHTRRLGPFPARVRDVGVVVDLATHDLDIMRYLVGDDVVRVFAETERRIHTSNEDIFGGLIRFENETLGILEINWLTPSKIRELYVTGERGMFIANYLTQDLYFYENAEQVASPVWDALTVLRGVSEGAMTRYALTRKEPLRAEQEAFLAAVAGDASRIVPGEDGMEALRLALALIESGQKHTVVPTK